MGVVTWLYGVVVPDSTQKWFELYSSMFLLGTRNAPETRTTRTKHGTYCNGSMGKDQRRYIYCHANLSYLVDKKVSMHAWRPTSTSNDKLLQKNLLCFNDNQSSITTKHNNSNRQSYKCSVLVLGMFHPVPTYYGEKVTVPISRSTVYSRIP